MARARSAIEGVRPGQDVRDRAGALAVKGGALGLGDAEGTDSRLVLVEHAEDGAEVSYQVEVAAQDLVAGRGGRGLVPGPGASVPHLA